MDSLLPGQLVEVEAAVAQSPLSLGVAAVGRALALVVRHLELLQQRF